MKAFWPDQLSDYQDPQLLNAGQYGLVYKTINPVLQQKTAIKLIEVSRDIKPVLVKRFKREIKSLKKINSPHVVKLINFWIEPTFLAFEMEYVPGLSLTQVIKALAEVSYREKQSLINRIIRQICLGLQSIHQANLIHRDLKPSNILIELPEASLEGSEISAILNILQTHDFAAKISDLGVVKDLSASVSITKTTDFVGTAEYVAPEQILGKKITPNTDLYSLGIIWYELITGKNPFHRSSIYDTIQSHLSEEPPHIQSIIPEVALDVAHILTLLLQREPRQRFYTANRLVKLLQSGDRGEEDASSNKISLLLSKSEFAPRTPPLLQKKLNEHFIAGGKKGGLTLISGLSEFPFIPDTHSETPGTRTIYLNLDQSTGFIYPFIDSLISSLSPREKSNFNQQIQDHLIYSLFWQVFTENDFYLQCNLIRKDILSIPEPVRVYNLIQFTLEILKFLSAEKTLLVFLPGLEKFIPNYNYFFQFLCQQLQDISVYFFLPLTAEEMTTVSGKVDGDFPMGHLQIPPDLGQSMADTLPEFETTLHGGKKKYKRSEQKPLPTGKPPLDESILDLMEYEFLKYFILSGKTNSVDFLSWLLENQFEGNSDILLSLLKKQMLIRLDLPGRINQFSLHNGELYDHLLSTMPEEEKSGKMEAIITYWETPRNLYSQERLKELLMLSRQHARLASLMEELLDFYSGVGDFPHLKNHYTSLTGLEGKSRVIYHLQNRATIKTFWEATKNDRPDSVLEEAMKLHGKLSGKQKEDRDSLRFIIIFNALKTRNFSLADKFLLNDGRTGWKGEQNTSLIRILQTLKLIMEEDLKAAEEEICDVLFQMKENQEYGYIPTGSLILSWIYTKFQDWPKSYRYAAMAFQAGKTINDFWVMEESLKLIEQNAYYHLNKHQLVNWSEVREIFPQSSHWISGEYEWRNLLLTLIHENEQK
ncbi:MAG: hypothetical protein Kow0042_17380 [Calditrichia bacterium]